MRFKKVYVEITNVCNLRCPFCEPHNRPDMFMTYAGFKTALIKVRPFADHIYLHVKGEPLIHPRIAEFTKLAKSMGYFVNLTTNATLLKDNLHICEDLRQINISLHSTLDLSVLSVIKEIKDTRVSIRLWNRGKNRETLNALEKEFGCTLNDDKRQVLAENIFLSVEDEFRWPKLDDDTETDGFCRGLKDQIGILADGTVVPCCLDHNGEVSLGNIFEEGMSDILSKKRAADIIEGFRNNKAVEPLCRKCRFKDRFIKSAEGRVIDKEADL